MCDGEDFRWCGTDVVWDAAQVFTAAPEGVIGSQRVDACIQKMAEHVEMEQAMSSMEL